MVKSKDSILKDYQNNVEIQQTQIASLKKTLNKISLSRLGLFLIEIAFVTIIITTGYHWIIGILMCIPVICFMAVIKRQTRLQNNLSYAEQLLFIFQNEVNQITQGKNAYSNGEVFADELHPYASDLDIYGSSSLYAFINRSNTTNGMKFLAATLGKPGKLESITERQEAITELKSHIEQTFHFRAGLQSHQPKQLETIAYKLQHEMPEQLKFTHSKALQFYTRVAPLFSFGLLILGSVYGGVFWQFLTICLLFNVGLTILRLKDINLIYYGFSGSSSLLNSVSDTIKWTEEVKWESSYIKRFFTTESNAGWSSTTTKSNSDTTKESSNTSKRTANTTIPLNKQIKELSSIIQAFDVRLNILLGSLFNAFVLWDFRCSIRLYKWHIKSSAQLIKGLYTISQFEELISFATFTYNQPEWVFPVLSAGFHFEAKALGHPLITEHKRISNDYNFEGQPVVDIVTGSNMAGKSTFLRTVGINMVLAFSGATVCAASMKLSIFDILTYMRIKDSLNDQTSTFKAELNRLKMILEGVKSLSHPLVLIDEMLRGTNSKDKYLGSKVFIQQMIAEKTPTLFATHDLQLSEMIEKYPQEIRNYHFDIQLSEGEMNFDYKLKDGACKTFNAALLLKEIGLSFNPDEHL